MSDLLSLEQVHETVGPVAFHGREPNFGAAVRALLVPAVHTRFPCVH